MKIEEFLNEGSCINKKFNFDGFIFSKNTKTIITDNIMSEDVFIDISSSEIWSHLNKYIAPFGGGKWDFVDKCHIELLLSKVGNNISVKKILTLSIFRKNVEYLIINEEWVLNSNINNVINNIYINKIFIGEVSGYLVLNNKKATINSISNISSLENKSINISIQNIEDFIEEYFIADDKWPVYQAFVNVHGTLEMLTEKSISLTSVIKWELIYKDIEIIITL